MSANLSLTRRRFLIQAGRTAGACSAAMLPWFVPASALGAGSRGAASERIVTGYIGVGPRGVLNLREQLSCPQAQVVAVCDVWRNRCERAKQIVDTHYGNKDCRAYVDFRELIDRPDIDAVGIATPDHWHVPITIMAARAGKDVCTEKPLGVSIEQDLLCRDTIRRYKRVFQYGTEARAMADCRFGAELVRNGYIGQIRKIRVKSPNSVAAAFRAPRPVPAELDYSLWLGPAPWRPYAGCPDAGPRWYHVYDYALGFIAGWGAHPLDLMVWAYDVARFGPWEVEGEAVVPEGEANDAVRDWKVEIRLGNGVPISYFAAGVPAEEDPRLAGRNDYVQLIGTEGWVALYYGGMQCEPQSLRSVKFGPDAVRLPVSHGQERNFLEAVARRSDPVSHIDDAVCSDLLSHVSDIAVRLRRKVVWDPQAECFIDDPQAQRMTRRAAREPWAI